MEWKNVKEVLSGYGEALEEAYRQEVVDKQAFASGRLFDSVRAVVDIDGRYIELSLSLEEYWKYVEEGRGPGKFPPLDKIEEWVRIKNIAPYPDSRGRVPSVPQLAYLIGRKIAEEGTEGQHLLEDALNKTDDWMRLIEEAIEADVAEEINEILSKL